MTTPMMQQWHACKAQAKNALLLFRLGDFYEAFYEDAEKLARDLELTLTKRQEVPMAGIPFHAAEKYIDQLIAKGHLVAIAEQTSSPKEGKGIVERKVVRTISPATVFSDTLLSSKQNNYFASLAKSGNTFGLVLLDLTTGELRAKECGTLEEVESELERAAPAELLLSKRFPKKFSFCTTEKEEWHFDLKTNKEMLMRHFGVAHLDGFGLKESDSIISAAGTLLTHLADDLCLPIDHIQTIDKIPSGQFMAIDATTARHLELFTTLLDLLDETRTPMGARLLKKWLMHPLLSVEAIEARQTGIEELKTNPFPFIEALHPIRDIERLITRITTKNASPRDVGALKNSLAQIPSLKESAAKLTAPLSQKIAAKLIDHTALVSLLETALEETLPMRATDGNIIRKGYNAELDELRALKSGGEEWLASYQMRLREETGNKKLKVGYTRAFGYYIEVTRASAHTVPLAFHKRQTLTNAERYISEELKEYETKIFSAEEKIEALEQKLYLDLVSEVAKQSSTIRTTARAIAHIDALLSLATLARTHGYNKPTVVDNPDISIKEGAHPVLAGQLMEQFIPNDTELSHEKTHLMLITGPNMAGKSTYIRQVALLTIMAQIGSYIPAKEARIGIVDQIFSRIGASDDLARGQSTFMVEMSETANILRNATARSLVILDEIGRGTSTYDGISIAWAVAEHLLKLRAKTLFATHYWELNELASVNSGASNFNVAVDEGDEIVFLHKIVPGGTDKSYGIHVAKLAGLPPSVIKRAEERLRELETIRNPQLSFLPL